MFAAGIVLFIMVAGTPPFSVAERNEFYYKLICNNRWEMFWKYHCKGKPSGQFFFSENFKNLMQYMLAYSPSDRLSTQELRAHPWFQGDLPSPAEVQAEMRLRQEVNDEEAAMARHSKGERRGLGEEEAKIEMVFTREIRKH